MCVSMGAQGVEAIRITQEVSFDKQVYLDKVIRLSDHIIELGGFRPVGSHQLVMYGYLYA